VRYLLDTDTCIRLRSRRLAHLRERFLSLAPDDAAISAITYGELRVGAEKSVSPADAMVVLGQLLLALPVLPVTSEVGDTYAQIRADLERRGQSIGANDLWIAAHARTLQLTLVTGNEREFRRVPGLSVENWTVAA
jgi:tRNA(fMet)-specific endonuclease VapC